MFSIYSEYSETHFHADRPSTQARSASEGRKIPRSRFGLVCLAVPTQRTGGAATARERLRFMTQLLSATVIAHALKRLSQRGGSVEAVGHVVRLHALQVRATEQAGRPVGVDRVVDDHVV